jgi:hypothetical protein
MKRLGLCVADATVLYDASGQALATVGIADQAGMFLGAPPPSAANGYASRSQPVVTPARPEVPQSQVTTQQVQAAAEYAANDAEVLGGDTYIPFGPPIRLPDDGADPGYRYADTPDGPRRTFRIAKSIGLMPLLRFAHAAKSGLDTDDLEGMAALYTMIADVVDPDDWTAFQEYATMIKAEDEELMEFVSSAMEVIAARPRKRRGNSSATSQNTRPKSKGSSSGQATPTPTGARTPEGIEGLMPVSDLI